MSTVTNYGWTRRSPATVPPPRQAASMAYDAAVGNVVLFGGLGLSNLLNDTWMWDGRTWIQQKPAMSPPARMSAGMADDAARGKLVLFGGTDENGLQLNDTWTWDGTTWTKQHPVAAPTAGHAVRMAYDAAQQSMVLFSTMLHKALNVATGKVELPTGTLETWTR
jgi:Galactose oxidase, central domain